MASTDTVRRKKERKKRRAQRMTKGQANGSSKGEVPSKKQKSKLREWADALIFAVVVMLIVRTFIFDLFRIPTPSMEKSLLVGDYLFVSKLHYGTRTPMTLGIPFTQIYLKGIELPHTRFPGFTSVKRSDAIVFNYPAEDKPIDRKMHYIKRVVGLPGDALDVRDKVVHINGEAAALGEEMQHQWFVHKKDQRYRLPASRLRTMGITEVTEITPVVVRILATEAAVEELKTTFDRYIDRVEPSIAPPNAGYSEVMYPPGQGYTPDNYGPVTVPAMGQTVTLTAENWLYYQPVIERYEGHTTRLLQGGSFEIDGVPTTTYTFAQDYYFVMGDNRDNSEDSRFWGFVPMDHVVGKAILIYFSWDEEDSPPIVGQIRFSRLFHFIH